MGCDMNYLNYLDKKGVFSNSEMSVLDIGAQNLYLAEKKDIENFILKYNPSIDSDVLENESKRLAQGSARAENGGFTNGSFVYELMELANIDYLSFDIFSNTKCEVFDLNFQSLSEKYVNKFDLVMNFGTTEHVFNQFNSFKVIHEATKPGGYIYHQLPGCGYVDHGYFTYSPKFFFELSNANNYSVLDAWMSGPQSHTLFFDTVNNKEVSFFDETLCHNDVTGWQNSPTPNGVINILLRKNDSSVFKLPLETSTTIMAPPEEILSQYSAAA